MAYFPLLTFTIALLIWSQLLCIATTMTNRNTDFAQYVYPKGSIPCKLYNQTNVDCKYRTLVSIPPLPHRSSLERLDLSYNSLPYLPDDAFHGLRRLKVLDLSYNELQNITGSPFKDLKLLQELNLENNWITSLSGATFTGLISLKSLNILMNLDDSPSYLTNISGTPFIELQSLRVLKVSVDPACDNVIGLFIGLDNLLALDLDVCCDAVDWSDGVCLLGSLNTLRVTYYPVGIASGNKCFQEIPLKYLYYDQRSLVGNPPAFVLFGNLTSLMLRAIMESCADVVTFLSPINSPLEELILDMFACYDYTYFVLNSTTLAPWAKWNSSLYNIDIRSDIYLLEGSPFAWFTNLRTLRLYNLHKSIQFVTALPRDTFKGLENLEELSLNGNFDVITTNALHVFNHLKHLWLRNNQIDHISADQFCSHLSDLTYLDLSQNMIFAIPCQSIPSLRILKMTDNNQNVDTNRLISTLCKMSPNLHEIDISGSFAILEVMTAGYFCPNLVNLNMSQTRIVVNYNTTYWPHVNTLHLAQLVEIFTDIWQPLSSVKQIMVAIRAPELTNLDLSSNQIEEIDKKDVTFLRNLTYLNLANNKLTSVGNLRYLANIHTLLLNGNKITIVPKVLLSQPSHLFLEFLDLRNNAFACDCTVEPLRLWILGDTDVYLEMGDGSPLAGLYQCSLPDSLKGVGVTEIDLDCRSPLWLYMSISIPSACTVILIAILAIKYRWHIQYKLFLVFNRRKRYHNYIDNAYEEDDDDDENGIPRFDAYVAYHEEDEDWIDGELLRNIEVEEEPFRLCLRSRDVPAGRPLISAVSLCIQRSRKSLMILTPCFVEDNWCYFQLSMAHQRLLEEGHNVLILIILKEIPNDKMTLILRQLFCKVRCLKWPNDAYGQGLFWQRLREEIKIPILIDRRYNIYPQR